VLPAWDLITGQMVAVGLLAAERHRRRSGQGQHVKLALEDVALAVMQHLGFIAEAQQGQPRERPGNARSGAFGQAFLGAYGARVMVVGLPLERWSPPGGARHSTEAVAALGGRPGLAPRQEGTRSRARAAIADLLRPWFAARPF